MTNDFDHSSTQEGVRKRRRGRPSVEYPRVVTLKLRASIQEAAQIKSAANASRLPMATYLRKSALAERMAMIPVGDIETAAQIARVGNIVDQAVRLCESGKADWPANELTQLREICEAIAVRLTASGPRNPNQKAPL